MLVRTTWKDYEQTSDFIFLAKAMQRIIRHLPWHSFTTWRVL